mmetsp:Transcript_51362/g.164207  ORF Transcript_51362/g.164207 Transcript_51362/m.164207 type:complete len:250 (+) Transcript_51362:99-848(+)
MRSNSCPASIRIRRPTPGRGPCPFACPFLRACPLAIPPPLMLSAALLASRPLCSSASGEPLERGLLHITLSCPSPIDLYPSFCLDRSTACATFFPGLLVPNFTGDESLRPAPPSARLPAAEPVRDTASSRSSSPAEKYSESVRVARSSTIESALAGMGELHAGKKLLAHPCDCVGTSRTRPFCAAHSRRSSGTFPLPPACRMSPPLGNASASPPRAGPASGPAATLRAASSIWLSRTISHCSTRAGSCW